MAPYYIIRGYFIDTTTPQTHMGEYMTWIYQVLLQKKCNKTS